METEIQNYLTENNLDFADLNNDAAALSALQLAPGDARLTENVRLIGEIYSAEGG